jgi:hypothetical protein
MSKPLTMFSWGYWGWGGNTAELLRLTSAVEAERAFPYDCHRSDVAKLLLRAARLRRQTLEIVEWPGGERSAEPPRCCQGAEESQAKAFKPDRSGRLSPQVRSPTGWLTGQGSGAR